MKDHRDHAEDRGKTATLIADYYVLEMSLFFSSCDEVVEDENNSYSASTLCKRIFLITMVIPARFREVVVSEGK